MIYMSIFQVSLFLDSPECNRCDCLLYIFTSKKEIGHEGENGEVAVVRSWCERLWMLNRITVCDPYSSDEKLVIISYKLVVYELMWMWVWLFCLVLVVFLMLSCLLMSKNRKLFWSFSFQERKGVFFTADFLC